MLLSPWSRTYGWHVGMVRKSGTPKATSKSQAPSDGKIYNLYHVTMFQFLFQSWAPNHSHIHHNLPSNFLHPAFMAWTLDFSAASRSFFNNPSSGTNEKERMVVKSMVNDAGLAFVNILKIQKAWEGCELVLFDAFNAGRGKMTTCWVPHLHQIHLWNDDGVP